MKMKLVNKVELRLEKYEKCSLFCDSDCGLGELFDFSSALKSYMSERIRAQEESEKPIEKEELKTE